jgi:hypothetical protein
MAGLINNIFAGLGLSLVFPLVLFVVLSIFLAIMSGK